MTDLRSAVVDLAAIRHNIQILMDRIAPAELMVIVKANAYGHGAIQVAQVAADAGIRHIGALDIASARALRTAGLSKSVSVLAWQYVGNEDFGQAIDEQISLGVSQLSELEAIATASASPARDHPAILHLKIDTGLNRNGSTEEDWPALVERAVELERAGLVTVVGVWTHIAEASDEEDTLAVRRFERAVAIAEQAGAHILYRHLAASSAGFRRDDVRFDLVRMGGHVWGIPSFDGVTARVMGLRPALTASALVTALENRPEGDSDHWIAQIAVGYADGIASTVVGNVVITINGKQFPSIESVGPDSLLLHVDASVRVGDRAILFGPGDHGEQTIREWGDNTHTLGDEIAARLGRRFVWSVTTEEQ